MNYYLFQSKFFIIFIAIAAMAFAAIPFMKNSFADVSDSYIKNQINYIQGEILFIDIKEGAFDNLCTQGEIGKIVNDVVQNSIAVKCLVNPPINNKIMICAQLKTAYHYCVDYLGTSCELAQTPSSGFSCRESH